MEVPSRLCQFFQCSPIVNFVTFLSRIKRLRTDPSSQTKTNKTQTKTVTTQVPTRHFVWIGITSLIVANLSTDKYKMALWQIEIEI